MRYGYPYFEDEIKKLYDDNILLQKNYIPVTSSRKERRKTKYRSKNWRREFSDIYQLYLSIKKNLDWQDSQHLRHRLPYALGLKPVYAVIICLCFIFTQYLNSFGSAISVPPEARDTAAALIETANQIVEARQDRLEIPNAAEYVSKAEHDLAAIKGQMSELEELIAQESAVAAQAKEELQVAEEEMKLASQYAEMMEEIAQSALADVEQAYQYADAVEAELAAQEQVFLASNNSAQTTYSDFQASDPQVDSSANAKQVHYFDEGHIYALVQTLSAQQPENTDELLRLEQELREQEKIRQELENARETNIPMVESTYEENSSGFDWSLAEAAHARAEYLNNVYEAAEWRARNAEQDSEDKIASWNKTLNKSAQADMFLENSQMSLADLETEYLTASEYAAQTRSAYERLVYLQQNPPPSYYVSVDENLYNWFDDRGNNGWQLIDSFYYGSWRKNFSYSIATNLVMSRNNTRGRSGGVNTLTDTTLFVATQKETEKYIFNYGLSFNLPTGKPTLSWKERHARMNEDLVQLSEFGKGWQITPSFAVSRKIGEEDMWTIGTSYTFSGAYDPTSDIPGDTLSPGGEWRKFIRWQHAGQKWQFAGELINTTTSPTGLSGGDSYDGYEAWEPRLTYNRKLSETQNLMFYYWLERQSASDIPFDNSGGLVHYFGTMWSKKIKPTRTFRVTFDVMSTNGSRYAGIDNYYDVDTGNPQYRAIDVNGRKKYTYGIGYDIDLPESNSRISIDLQGFTMNDGASSVGDPPTQYTGFNVLARYSRSF